MVARFGRNQDTHTSRRIGDEWKNSAFVSTVFNVFTDKRVLTNDMVKEAIGHSCDALEIRDSDSCRNSPYATIDWEAAVYQWKFTPSKELVKKAMGDFCYFSSKFVCLIFLILAINEQIYAPVKMEVAKPVEKVHVRGG